MAADMAIAAPMVTHTRRPRISATYEAGMKARKEPSETAAMIRPLVLESSPSRNFETGFC